MKIIRRKLTPEEAKIISEEIKETESISAYAPKDLEEENNSYVITENENFAGVAITDQPDSEWSRFKILILLKNFRNKGLGKKVFQQLLEKSKKERKKFYFTSGNLAMIQMAKKFGFKKIHIARLPLKISIYELKNLFKPYWIKESVKKLFRAKGKISFKFFVQE